MPYCTFVLMDKQVQILQKEIIELKILIKFLLEENAELKRRLSKYEHPKNSNNSSVPPSKDENRPVRKSLRKSSGQKPGGQKGRKGKTLKMVENPDIIEKHESNYCRCCGNSLASFPSEFIGKRQVFDIIPIKIKITQHQIYRKQCSCGCINESDYPAEANAPASYGNNIESLIGYLHTRQYIPFKRMQEILKDLFGAKISEGGLHYLLDKLVKKALPTYDLIKAKLEKNTKYAVGSDETSVKVAGNKHWAWTWQNQEATFITITDNRGQRSIDETFKNGFNNAVLVHDCWASHFNTPAMSHQICIVHLLRDLNYLNELYNHKWSFLVKEIFKQALVLKKKMKKVDFYRPNTKRTQLEKRLDFLIHYHLPDQKKELITFQKRLKKYRDYLFTFLYRSEVPPDNNASERAIRNIKVKQKVSGLFRSPNGAARFAVLRSITDTVLKNNQNVMHALKFIANFDTD